MALLDTKSSILLLGNSLMAASWFHVFLVFLVYGWNGVANEDLGDEGGVCETILRPRVKTALAVSFIELFNSLVGLTRSKPHQVILFSTVRAGVEILTAPLLPCTAWQHLWTVLIWSIGDVIRTGCFAIDVLLSSPDGEASRMVKSVRYTVGPFLFPLGAGGEMLMVIRAAMDDRPILYFAASLWPAGFYPLMKQLLKQRKKHFQKGSAGAVKKTT